MEKLYEREARQDEQLSKLADNGEEKPEQKEEDEPALWEGEP